MGKKRGRKQENKKNRNSTPSIEDVKVEQLPDFVTQSIDDMQTESQTPESHVENNFNNCSLRNQKSSKRTKTQNKKENIGIESNNNNNYDEKRKMEDHSSKSWKSREKKYENNDPTSLMNTGNTCYLNSTLQALHSLRYFNRALRKALLNLKKGSKILRSLQLQKAGDESYIVEFFERYFSKNLRCQSDPMEFLMMLFEYLDKKDPEILTDFWWEFESKKYCSGCHQSAKLEGVIEKQRIFELYVNSSVKEQFENLSQKRAKNEIYFCSKCDPHSLNYLNLSEIEEKLCVNPGKVLIFKICYELEQNLNNVSSFNFCVQQNLSHSLIFKIPCSSQNNDNDQSNSDKNEDEDNDRDNNTKPDYQNTLKYNLRAIITHIGTSTESGHYISYIFSNTKECYICNDGFIREVDVNCIEFKYSELIQPMLLIYEFEKSHNMN